MTDTDFQKQKFLSHFQVVILDHSIIQFVIPGGCSALDILRAAQELAPSLHRLNSVWPSRLEYWSTLPPFTESADKPCKVIIDADVAGAEWKTRDEQLGFLKERGLQLASLAHVTAAHALHFIATGKDLFDGRIVRIEPKVALYYGDGGLSQMDPGDFIETCRYQHVTTATESAG